MNFLKGQGVGGLFEAYLFASLQFQQQIFHSWAAAVALLSRHPKGGGHCKQTCSPLLSHERRSWNESVIFITTHKSVACGTRRSAGTLQQLGWSERLFQVGLLLLAKEDCITNFKRSTKLCSSWRFLIQTNSWVFRKHDSPSSPRSCKHLC